MFFAHALGDENLKETLLLTTCGDSNPFFRHGPAPLDPEEAS